MADLRISSTDTAGLVIAGHLADGLVIAANKAQSVDNC